MEILRWQAMNSLANYQHIVCDAEKNAVFIDPLDVEQIAALVKRLALRPRAVLVTHEHFDHAGESARMQEAYSIPVYSSRSAAPAIGRHVEPLADKGELPLSTELIFRLHETPGHTPGHAVFEVAGLLFTGDCLFHAGCGHCRSAGASVDEHYRSLTERLPALNPDLVVFPGHYYARRNLDFALYVEPDNRRSQDLRRRLNTEQDESAHQTTLRQEREYNPFLRLHSRSLRRRLSELTGKDFTEASALQVFIELRQLRDAW